MVAGAGRRTTTAARDTRFVPQAVTVTFVTAGRNAHEVPIEGLVKGTAREPSERCSFTITPEQQREEWYREIHEGQEG